MTLVRLNVCCLSIFFTLAFASICDATELASDQKKNDSFLKPARPFTAILVEYNKHNESKKNKTKLTISNHGMRSESLTRESDGPQLLFIQDYNTSRTWLASPARACFSVLPEGETVDSDDGDSDLSENSQPGVLSTNPCPEMKAEKLSTRMIRDTELSVWKCTDGQGRVFIQHFSSLLGMVIRQETQEGEVGELQEISLVSQSPEYFKPPSQWREVTLEEFITGNPALPAYKD